MMSKVLCLYLLITLIRSDQVFTLYPLANDYFDIIYVIKPVSNDKTNSNQQQLFLRVYCKDLDVVSVSLTPTLDFRQEPRFPIYSRQSSIRPKFQQEIFRFLSACNVQVKVHPSVNSIVKIIRKDNNQPIFQLKDVVLSQGHNKFTVVDRSTKWGLGQRFQKKFKVTEGHWTIWNRDKPWEIDTGKQGRSSNTYGHQPLYLAKQKIGGYTHLTYFKNTHGLLFEASDQGDNIKFNSIGGNIHFLIFAGDKDPEKTLKKYHQFIGGIHIPPFWALGWHQCRWGYKNIRVFSSVVDKYQEHNIPLDTMWNDLDYMSMNSIFTIDEGSYPPNQLKNLLKSKNLHWIPLIDVGVSLKDQESINQGRKLDVFLRNPLQPANYYVGEVWPGKVHFVDYLHPNASFFWKNQLNRLYEKAPFSGVWLDMNQPSNFRGNEPVTEAYRIQQTQSINQMTINIKIKHYTAFDNQVPLTHQQVHSYYGHFSAIPTFDFLKQHGRPFIISRSNSVGTGKYSGHWTGDNVANWDFLRLSISGNFLYQIFGIQMVGADICGFNLSTTEELCSRWTQLGSLYPFARNHNQLSAKDQQPYALGEQVLKTAQISIRQRYSLLKQLYSILVDLNGKGTFFRPIYFEFYEDNQALNDETIETQFLLGKGLMSAPIVQISKQNRSVYFPDNSNWHALEYDVENPGLYRKQTVFKSINQNKQAFYQGGKSFDVINKIPSSPPLFLRGGYMIFSNKPEQRSKFLNSQYYLTAALDSTGLSKNRFLTISDYENETLLGKCIQKSECMTEFTLTKGQKQSQFEFNWKFKGDNETFGSIQFLSVVVWEKDLQFIYKGDNIKIDVPAGSLNLELTKNNS